MSRVKSDLALAVGFAILTLVYAINGWSLSYWPSIGALALLALMFGTSAVDSWLIHEQRRALDIIDRRSAS